MRTHPPSADPDLLLSAFDAGRLPTGTVDPEVASAPPTRGQQPADPVRPALRP